MDHYIDIHLRPDPEFHATVLMNALYGKLHRALTTLDQTRVGVSFPEVEHAPALGTSLRLHGSQADLADLMDIGWLNGMRDHAEVGAIGVVPATAMHRQVRRIQPRSSTERIRRRQIKRHDLTEEEARKRVPLINAELLELPFVTLNSRSTQQRFRLFIEHSPIRQAAAHGIFNSYGLSNNATVPWF